MRQVADGHQQLRGQFDDTWQRHLEQSVPDPLALLESQSALAAPLIPWDGRVALRQKHASIAAELHANYLALREVDTSLLPEPESPIDGQSTAALSPSPTADAKPLAYRERMSRWDQHPLLALLGDFSPTDADGDPSTESSEASTDSTTALLPASSDDERQVLQSEIRRRLRALGSTYPDETDRGPTMDKMRRLASRAERRARAAAPIWHMTSDVEPLDHLRVVDLQQLVIWHGQRVLDDFWTDEWLDPEAAVPSGDEFYIQASRDYAMAAKLLGGTNSAIDQAVNRQTEVAARRGNASLTVKADSRPVVGQTNAARIMMEISSESGEWDLPVGHAALFIRDAGQRIVDWSVAKLNRESPVVREPEPSETLDELPPPDPPAKAESSTSPSDYGPSSEPGVVTLPIQRDQVQRLQINVDDVTTVNPRLEVVTIFRGHEFSSPFLMHGLTGQVVDYVPHTYGPPRVTLYGDQRQRLSVVFVLDCSASMDRPILVESISEDELPRLELAKSALATMLRELASRGDARVGVRFFGQRLGWSTSKPVRVLTQTNYEGRIPSDISPSNDIETILTLGRFDSVDAGTVIRKMESVEPWGQSPLYRSLAESLRDFSADDEDTRRSIVVITDGCNYQFSPSDGESRDLPADTYADVISA